MIRVIAGIGVLIIGVLATACSRPAEEGATFREDVLPVLEARCAATVCHGITAAQRDAGATLPDDSFVLDVDARGAVIDWRQAREAVLRGANTQESPAFSSVLRKPLPQIWSGLPHQGGDNFTSPQDPGYVAVRDWIAAQPAGGQDPDPWDPSPALEHFAENVQPQLVGRGCGLANCHGPTAFIPFRLDPGIIDDAGATAFSAEITLANYAEVRPFLSLDGHPLQSRVVRKSLPLAEGGILHRGGNRSFFPDPQDPAVEALTRWATLEREAAGLGANSSFAGLVFVRGPVEPASAFDPSNFVGGRDLFLMVDATPGSEEVNLTAAHHTGPADIRDPDGSPEATHVVFSMRRSSDDAHRIYELDLATGVLEQLTDGPARTQSGRAVADLSPAYGADGQVYFSSNRHDVMAERHDGLDYDIYRVPRAGGEVERLTYTPGPELEPAMFRVGTLEDYVVFSYRRAVDGRDKTVGFSLPVDKHVDYHIYFGITPEPNLFHQFEEMPDGRSVVIVGDAANVWSAGQLAVVDRNFGPDFPPDIDARTPGVPAFAETLRVLDPGSSPRGVSAGAVYRDPVAAADGTVFVARAIGPVDLSDPTADPDFGIFRITLSEGAAETTIATADLVSDTAADEFDPEPLYVWPAAGEPRDALDPEAPTLFSMADATVNDGIMADLAPVAKQFRDDVRFVRFVEAIPAPPGAWAPMGEMGSQPTTRGLAMPARILGEVALADDGSIYVELPPNTPFRTQLLDADRMSVGVQHNRWIFAWPGQHFKQSSPRNLYDQICGGCHGAQSGQADELLGVPDLTTRATVTLSRYVDANPRMPGAPVVLGAESRVTTTFADVQPILDRSCVDSGCHDGSASGGVELTGGATEFFTTAYDALVPALVDVQGTRARASVLAEVVFARQLDAPGDPADHPTVELSDEERLTIVRWIEVGAPYSLPD